MGRRRKHGGGLALASDQIPGNDQNNIRSGLVTFYCITTRPFAVTHDRTLPYNLGKSKRDSNSRKLYAALVRSRGRQRTLRKERDCVQAVER
jgi:hypothetical protein